jgi:hypothetical protein
MEAFALARETTGSYGSEFNRRLRERPQVLKIIAKYYLSTILICHRQLLINGLGNALL